MNWRKRIFWLATGLFLVFIESFFISHWLTLLWVIFISWREKQPWWLILFVALASDYFLVNRLGKSVFFYFLVALAAKGIFWLIGWKKEVKISLN